MGQDRDEPVTSFVARPCGHSNLCDFQVKCSHGDDTSYQDHIIAHQLVQALDDNDIQDRVMASHGDSKDTPLNDLVMFVQAQEMGRRNQGLLAVSGDLIV